MDRTTGNLPAVIDGIMTAMTFSKREEVKAWEQEFIPCEHTLCLAQEKVADSESKGTHPFWPSHARTLLIELYRY